MPRHGVTSCVRPAPPLGVFAGDTRGNVVFFPAAAGAEPCALRNLHSTLHVTDLSYHAPSRTLYSTAHDGKVQLCSLLPGSRAISPRLHLAAPFGRTLTRLVRAGPGNLVVGGYHAGTFYVHDFSNE
jgi:hypothetical protein